MCVCVDPVFCTMCFNSMVQLAFFICEEILFLEKTWSHHLFLFYFLKGKQNKKENLKCDF